MTTPPFLSLTRRVAAELGRADLAVLVVPHPLGGTDPDEVRRWGAESAEIAARALAGTPVPGSDQAEPARLADLQQTLRQDGAELRLERIEGGVAHLTLELADARCAECVMPAEFIERLAGAALAAEIDGLGGVVVHDPRREDR